MDNKKWFAILAVTCIGYGMDTNRVSASELQGMRVSGFELLPSISISSTSDDNVFSQQDNPVSDTYQTIHPQLSILNDWETGSVGLMAEMDSLRFNEYDSQDRDDYHLMLDAVIEAAGEQSLAFSAAASRVSEDQNSSENFRGNTLIVDETQSLSATYNRQAGWLGISLKGVLDSFDFKHDQAYIDENGEDLRNRDENSMMARLGYGMEDSRQVYLHLKIGDITHNSLDNDPSFNRDANYRETGVGFNFSDDGPWSLQGEVGGYQQAFDGDHFGNVDGIYHLGELNWQLSALTLLQFSSSLSFQQTGIRESAGYEETLHRFYIKHELTRFLNLTAAYEWGNDSYFNLTLEDEFNSYYLDARYNINRYLEVFARAASSSRTRSADSDEGGGDYSFKKQTITFGAIARL